MKSKKQIKIETARELRRQATFAEDWLWQKLKDRKLRGIKFRRQYIFRGFVLDFYCPECRVGIELDGPVHIKQKDYDDARDKLINNYGINIIRLKNRDVIDNLDEALNKIINRLGSSNKEKKNSKHVLPLHDNGEGDRG